MAGQRSWVWEHFDKVDSETAECNKCGELFSYLGSGTYKMKLHLMYSYGIKKEEENLKWKTRIETNLIWQYFSKEDGYRARCKNCGKEVSHGYNISNLDQHLVLHLDIVLALREKFARTWLSEYYTVHELKAKCNICIRAIKLYEAIDTFTHHLDITHGVRNKVSGCEGKPGDNNANAMMQRNTFAGPSSSGQSRQNWMWKHFAKTDSHTARCNNCGELFSFPGNGSYKMKLHLMYSHGIKKDEVNLKWKTKVETNPIWQYFSKKDGYRASCKSCGNGVIRGYDLSHLDQHLWTHSDIVLALRRKIACTWLSEYYTVDKLKVICNKCPRVIKLYEATATFKDHLDEEHGITNKDSGCEERPGDNNANAMMQQNNFAGPSSSGQSLRNHEGQQG